VSDFNEEPPEGQDPVLPSLSWSDPEAARRWISGLTLVLDDVLAAAGDQMLPLRQRRLGHVEADRLVREATVALHRALAYAERGLPPVSTTAER
jgi:hypothetical protein